MQNSRLNLARKIFFFIGALLGLVLLAGCEAVTLTNLTPPSIQDNPSRIYTITLRVTTKSKSVVPGSVVPHIIIDGQNQVMAKSPLGEGIYEYEYHLPPGRTTLAYYFLVNYEVSFNERNEPRETYSEINNVEVVSRYVLSLEANRGPIGARVSLLGRGFTPQDVLYFDSMPVRTVYESSTSLSFFVPALGASHNYQVTLASVNGNTPVGTFRIDPSSLSVFPTSLNLRTGDVQILTFTVANPAPLGGILLDVTTDIPESVIMDEVIIPAGQTTLAINVQGGRPGSGNLYLKGFEAGEVTIPVTVTAR
ncbi:MAG: cell surface protein [Cephaloticoccus sp.]|nr:cell surface protein [Cephaloticoccus sp.]MCF7760526.1 cell surface protein [Cephaloticoccus sp.]